jgi:hypothetical protein
VLQHFNLNFSYESWYPQFNVTQNDTIVETLVEALNGQLPGEPVVHIIYKSPTTGQTIVVGDVEQNQFVRPDRHVRRVMRKQDLFEEVDSGGILAGIFRKLELPCADSCVHLVSLSRSL